MTRHKSGEYPNIGDERKLVPFAVQLLNEQAMTDSKQSLYSYDLHFEKNPWSAQAV